MAELDVAHEAKDIIFKRVGSVLGDSLFERFGIKVAPIVRRLPGDLPLLTVQAQYADLLYELADDTLVLFEMQSTSTREDPLRFGDYSWAAFRQHQKRAYVVVLYGPRVTTAPEPVIDGGAHVVRFTQILLHDYDAEETLARLWEKTRRGEPLSGVDRVDLVLLVLMRQRRPLVELVRETLPLVEALPEAQRAEAVGTIVGLAYHYLEEPIAAAIMEVLKMSNALEEMLAESITRGRAEGRAEGQIAGKRDTLRMIVRSRFGEVPQVLEQRIAQADEATLDALVVRASTAARIEDIL